MATSLHHLFQYFPWRRANRSSELVMGIFRDRTENWQFPQRKRERGANEGVSSKFRVWEAKETSSFTFLRFARPEAIRGFSSRGVVPAASSRRARAVKKQETFERSQARRILRAFSWRAGAASERASEQERSDERRSLRVPFHTLLRPVGAVNEDPVYTGLRAKPDTVSLSPGPRSPTLDTCPISRVAAAASSRRAEP